MGFFNNLFKYRDAGKGPSAKNVENYGEPVRSLFTSSSILREQVV